MAKERYFAVPVLNTHRRAEKVSLLVEPSKGVKVAIGIEVAFAAPTVFPSPSKFVERVLDEADKREKLDEKVRARVLSVAHDEEARDPYLVASRAPAHSVSGEISRETAERLTSDRNVSTKLDEALRSPEGLVLPMRFRETWQLLFQVDSSIVDDPTKIKITVVAGKVPIATFPLYVAPNLPQKPKC